jgi:hypothetical protein
MSAAYELLETLQEDTIAVLKSTPTLAHANIIAEQNGDLESEVERLLGFTKSGSGGKRGLVLVVMQPEVTSAEANLPGPPMIVKQEIQVIEHPRINRTAAGTNLRSSHAALLALNALHLHGMGGHATYAEEKPIEPLPMKDGLVSHVVSVFARANGLQGPGKAGAVEAELGGGGDGQAASVLVSIDFAQFGEANSSQIITIGGRQYHMSPFTLDLAYAGRVFPGTDSGVFVGNFVHAINGTSPANRYDPVLTPPHADLTAEVVAFSVFGVSTFRITAKIAGSAGNSIAVSSANSAVSFASATLAGGTDGGSQLTLTTATPGASIRYTTNGTYPTPAAGTLYTAPFPPPPVGTTVRAAAYKTGLNPGDCLEFNITA